MSRLRSRLAFAGWIIVLVASCGEETTGPPPDNHVPDTAAPQVTLTRPLPGEIAGTDLVAQLTASDTAGVDSVFVSFRDSMDVEFRTEVLTAEPYLVRIAANTLVLGNYTVCARARDRLGNRSMFACATARVYPPVTLRRDRGVVDIVEQFPASVQTAAVYRNPYDVPVGIDLIEMDMGYGSAIDGPFRVVVWNVEGDKPGVEIEGTALRLFRGPFGGLSSFGGFRYSLPAHALVAVGLQQISSVPINIGWETMPPGPPRTYWVATPVGSAMWFPVEQTSIGLEKPMIRLTVRATGAEPTVLAPVSLVPRVTDATSGTFPGTWQRLEP